MSIRHVVGAVVGGGLALFLGAASSQAAQINGAAGFAGAWDNLPGPGTTTIVSALNDFDLDQGANAYVGGTGVGDFSTIVSAQAQDFNLSMTPFLIFLNDFDFSVIAVSNIVRDGLTCGAANNCSDKITFDMQGIVEAPGFEPTLFFGSFTGSGSCSNDTSDGVIDCDSNITASWSATLAANGQSVDVPEPVTMLMLGTSLLGLGLLRRRSA